MFDFLRRKKKKDAKQQPARTGYSPKVRTNDSPVRRDDSSDFWNPLNPLSPISPFNPLNQDSNDTTDKSYDSGSQNNDWSSPDTGTGGFDGGGTCGGE